MTMGGRTGNFSGRGPFPPRDRPGPPGLPPDYLRGGYFDASGNLHPELVTKTADEVALALGPGIKAAQLRRFFAKARFVEQKLDAGQPFKALKAEIVGLQPFAADSVRKGCAPPGFKEFIERNTNLAAADEKSFRKGFILHFQAVVAFHGYHFKG